MFSRATHARRVSSFAAPVQFTHHKLAWKLVAACQGVENELLHSNIDHSRSKLYALRLICRLLLLLTSGVVPNTFAAEPPRWQAKLDSRIRFYQTTELGVLVVGTEKSLYAVDGETGEVLWRRKHARLDEGDVAPVPGTDLLLLSLADSDRTRLDAADVLTGETLWRSDKVRGTVMQIALEPNANRLAVVCVRDAHGRAHDGLKRRPVVHVFDLSAGRELWKHEIESDIELMPARWEDDGDTAYTLNNYRPPVFLDDRLYLFYQGITSLGAGDGKERRREKFRTNEEGLALTEADPVADERYIYASGRGRVRALSRATGEVVWESKDLGQTPEMLLTRDALYVRTGGQFTHLRDGETVGRGPYGVSALDVGSGKIIWRYKGADKGITNVILADESTRIIADRDDLIALDATTGKRRSKVSHDVKQAAFVLINQRGEAVVGGTNEIAGFDVGDGHNAWRARHAPPGRGLLRTVAAVAARATSLYFRYGGAASVAFRGVQLLNAANSLRWSGLAAHAALPNLTSLAANYSREFAGDQFQTFGTLRSVRRLSSARVRGVVPRPSIDVEDRLLDRLDPARQLDRLAQFLLRRRRLAALRGEWMYFYTELEQGRGLAGVDINHTEMERAVRIGEPDERFISDEAARLLYVAQADRMIAYELDAHE